MVNIKKSACNFFELYSAVRIAAFCKMVPTPSQKLASASKQNFQRYCELLVKWQ